MDLKDPGKNPRISISSNGKEVKLVSYQNTSYQNISCNNCNNYVLGSKAIKSGKYYWEVDVSELQEWVVGVHQITQQKTSFQSQEQFDSSSFSGYPQPWRNISYSPGLAYTAGSGFGSQSQFSKPYVAQHVCSTYEPQCGYWVIGLQNHSRYNVFVDYYTSDSGVLTLSMTVPPRRIGVFVDYEARTVSFYNVTHHGFLIYQFSSCCFTHEIVPYFNLKNCLGPMTLCLPSS